MKKILTPLGVAAMLVAASVSTLRAGAHERKTVEDADKVIRTVAASHHQGIPPALLSGARAVAIVPHVVKAGLVLDRRFGRGVLLVREPGGRWGNPLFVKLEGGGVGLQAGVESSDLVLVFKTEGSLERILHGSGRLTLGRDVGVAVGHLGKEAEVARPGRRKAEVYAYSRSKGLFAGVSLEGDRLEVDGKANEAFYARRGVRPPDVLSLRGVRADAAVEDIRSLLTRMGDPSLPAPPPVIIALPRK